MYFVNSVPRGSVLENSERRVYGRVESHTLGMGRKSPGMVRPGRYSSSGSSSSSSLSGSAGCGLDAAGAGVNGVGCGRGNGS